MRITECPRDAMQGWSEFIPTESKINYLQELLAVGFDTLDFGSFVSAKAIPQLADTTEVLAGLNLDNTTTKLLAIIANTRGAQTAISHKEIHYLGFPFSISETFQQRNTNKSIAESLVQVKEIQELCVQHNKEMVVYISMGFGNPYGDEYHPELAVSWVNALYDLGIRNIAMSDTIGVATPILIRQLFEQLIPAFQDATIGAHFHSTPDTRMEKIIAAYDAGCRSFDAAINGIGGCPMAKDELVGNMATETILKFMRDRNITSSINEQAFIQAQASASKIFGIWKPSYLRH